LVFEQMDFKFIHYWLAMCLVIAQSFFNVYENDQII